VGKRRPRGAQLSGLWLAPENLVEAALPSHLAERQNHPWTNEIPRTRKEWLAGENLFGHQLVSRRCTVADESDCGIDELKPVFDII
jgi:hypothetical protein